jgi:2-keto-4-pentenoate hydratase
MAGWKVGAPTPDAEPFYAPLHAPTLFADGQRLEGSGFNVIGVEAEIAYVVAHDLPPRNRPYARAEVMAAMATMHPAIEIIDSRYADLGAMDPLSQRADQQNHGALATGPGRSLPAVIDPSAAVARLTIDGTVCAEAAGGNSAGDPVRLLVWLTNWGSRDWGGLRGGQVITTGSCTGTIFARPGTRVEARFGGLGQVAIALT